MYCNFYFGWKSVFPLNFHIYHCLSLGSLEHRGWSKALVLFYWELQSWDRIGKEREKGAREGWKANTSWCMTKTPRASWRVKGISKQVVWKICFGIVRWREEERWIYLPAPCQLPHISFLSLASICPVGSLLPALPAYIAWPLCCGSWIPLSCNAHVLKSYIFCCDGKGWGRPCCQILALTSGENEKEDQECPQMKWWQGQWRLCGWGLQETGAVLRIWGDPWNVSETIS